MEEYFRHKRYYGIVWAAKTYDSLEILIQRPNKDTLLILTFRSPTLTNNTSMKSTAAHDEKNRQADSLGF